MSKYWTKAVESELCNQAREGARGSINPLILQNLDQGHAIVRLAADGFPQGVATSIPKFIEKSQADVGRLIDLSRKRYGKPRDVHRDKPIHNDESSGDEPPEELEDFLQ
jgi:hypothetical protein